MFLLAAMIVVVAYVAGFGVNWWYISANAQTAQTIVPPQFRVFWESWNLLKSEFYGDLPSKPALVHGAIRGMLQSLGDPHSVLIEAAPGEIEQNNLQGSYGGIGAQLETRDNLIVLIPYPDSPAARAGLLAGDVILKVDDKVVSVGDTAQDIEALVRGPEGSKVKLTVHRIGVSEPIVVEITREKVEIPTVQARILPNTQIAYIRITLESAETAKELERALKTLLDQKPTGLILDLRNNPGGLFPDPPREVVGQFTKASPVVVYEKYRDGTEKPYYAGSGRLATDLPMAVLVNGGTASAAEIIAGALADNGRAVLIGEKTFGTGSVQSVHTLKDNAVLHVTIATWFTPKHNQIDGKGLTPPVFVVQTPESTAKGIDTQLDRAIQYLQTGS
jgi:carboxyl-terminal processing protease